MQYQNWNAPEICSNCSTALSATMRYCPQCGQGTEPHAPSVKEFVYELIGHHFALEGKLFITLRYLIFRPGRLTELYFSGKKVSFILPLRLYFSISFLLFLTLSVLIPNNFNSREVSRSIDRPIDVALWEFNLSGQKIMEGITIYPDGNIICNLPVLMCPRAIERGKQILRNGMPEVESIMEKSSHGWAYGMFLFMPVFALLTYRFFRAGNRIYAEHLVLSLHLHSAWFLMILTSFFFAAIF